MISFSVDPQLHVRTAKFTGIVNDAELLEAYAALLTAPDYDASLDDLIDLRSIERLEVSRDAMGRIITMYTPVDSLGVPTRLAIVAPSDVAFGVSRMYELLRGDGIPEEIRVFRSHEEAIKWLTDRTE